MGRSGINDATYCYPRSSNSLQGTLSMLRILTAWLLLTTSLCSQTALTPGVQVATGSQVVHADVAIQVTHQAAPTWTYVGTIPTLQIWGCVFDNNGYMWCGSNNPTAGGVFVSYNKGATWSTVTPSAISSCPSVRSVGLAPDGTVFFGQQACSTIHLYWANNVANPTGPYMWTKSTQNGGYSLAGDGPEIRFDIAADGQTIYVGTGVVSAGNNSVVLTSTDNARSFTLASGSPTHTKVSELLGAKTIGGYEYMSLSIASGTN